MFGAFIAGAILGAAALYIYFRKSGKSPGSPGGGIGGGGKAKIR